MLARSEERRRYVKKFILKHPDKSHNAIKREFVTLPASDRRHMANNTVQKIIKDFVNEREIDVICEGNRKYYRLRDSLYNSFSIDLEDEIKKRDDELESFRNGYARLSLSRRTITAIKYIKFLLNDINAIVLMSVFNVSDRKKYDQAEAHFKENVYKILELLRSDRKAENILINVEAHVSGRHFVAIQLTKHSRPLRIDFDFP